MKTKICIISSSRADYGIYLPLLQNLKTNSYFELEIIAFGTHLSEFHGYTLTDIEKDGYKTIHKISSLTVYKDQLLIEQIDTGVYASKTFFFNPASYKFKEVDISVDGRKLVSDKDFNTLGPDIGVPKPVSVELENGNKYHKIYTSILDVEEVGNEAKTNNSPELYHAAGAARYNMLFSQKYGITIPCNTDLEAGMAINLELENISYCSKEMGPDEKNSGTYIIQSLCHYLDSTKAVTSLEVIRDSYGLSFQRDESGDDSGRLIVEGKGLYDELERYEAKDSILPQFIQDASDKYEFTTM